MSDLNLEELCDEYNLSPHSKFYFVSISGDRVRFHNYTHVLELEIFGRSPSFDAEHTLDDLYGSMTLQSIDEMTGEPEDEYFGL